MNERPSFSCVVSYASSLTLSYREMLGSPTYLDDWHRPYCYLYKMQEKIVELARVTRSLRTRDAPLGHDGRCSEITDQFASMFTLCLSWITTPVQTPIAGLQYRIGILAHVLNFKARVDHYTTTLRIAGLRELNVDMLDDVLRWICANRKHLISTRANRAALACALLGVHEVSLAHRLDWFKRACDAVDFEMNGAVISASREPFKRALIDGRCVNEIPEEMYGFYECPCGKPSDQSFLSTYMCGVGRFRFAPHQERPTPQALMAGS